MPVQSTALHLLLRGHALRQSLVKVAVGAVQAAALLASVMQPGKKLGGGLCWAAIPVQSTALHLLLLGHALRQSLVKVDVGAVQAAALLASVMGDVHMSRARMCAMVLYHIWSWL
jgi:hypothetical protein